MQKISVISITLSVLGASLFISTANASIEWSGIYRIEGNHIKNPELGDHGKEQSYGLSHLVLRPKIVAGDGLMIYGQFNIFNNAAYPNSQLGQVFGSGIGTATPSSAQDSNAIGDNQQAEEIKVSQLYLTLNQEFGQLIVGRAPLHFGLGITHNAGRGLFDHWYDTRDLVGFKFVVGNMYILPMIGKISESAIGNNDDVNDYMIQAAYENPESDITLGVFYQMRRGSESASADLPVGPSTGLGDGTATGGGEIDTKTVNIYAERGGEEFRVAVEASFQSGETGAIQGGEKITLGGFGIAAEFEYKPEGSKWNWALKAGSASGDDPTTPMKFEGFIFDRNYDIGMLMFNHPLGQADFLRTGLETGPVRTGAAPDAIIDAVDAEAVSNVLYVSPRVRYLFNDRWSLDNTFVAGWLSTTPIANSGMSKDLGYEWDISLNFSPRKGVMWVNEVGVLFPGSAWENDGAYPSEFAFGLKTKAAISF